MSREGTMLQINYKNGIPDLINVYADEPLELPTLLGILRDSAAEIVETGNVLRAAGNLAPVLPSAPAQAAAPAQEAAPAATGGAVRQVADRYGNVWTYGLPTTRQTPRGPAILKEGRRKDGKPFKGWYDPAQGPEWTGARLDKTALWGPEFDD